MLIFLVWPGGVGKSTVWPKLAEKLWYNCIDLDTEFCDQVMNITEYIHAKWYTEYCYANSELFYKLLQRYTDKTVFILPSWFLVHDGLEELANKHLQTLKSAWKTVVLLPSEDKEYSTEIVVARQLQRWFWLIEEKERIKFLKRYDLYKNFGFPVVYAKNSDELLQWLTKFTAQMP